MKKFRHWLESPTFSSVTSSIVAIIVGLLFGFVILLFTNPSQAFDGFKTILLGGFTGGVQGTGNVLYMATPLILTGLSVGFAFKTGLFNIGASGQMIVGAYVAVLVGVKGAALGNMHWMVALLAAMIAGAIWAAVPGILKAFFNVHEVISSIMMNYIGMYLVNIMIVSTVYDKFKNQTMSVGKTAVLPKLGMDKIFEGSSLNSGFFIAILVVIVIYIILNKTVFGYELKACGHNPDASNYAGINSKRNIVFAMMIAGALAGCAGGLVYLAGTGKFIRVVDVLLTEGFMGIPVALLGLSNPIGIFFAAIFLGYITMGGFYMQLFDFVPEIIDIIIACIIYFSAFALIVKNIVNRILKKKEKEKTNTQDITDKGGAKDE
jgi:general nucleoside transport system permease protein